jgi:hypothetical protein
MSQTNSAEAELPATIFVPNFVDTNDYSPAAELGDLVFVTKGINFASARELHEKFARYFATARDGDMLLLSGSNLVCAIAYSEWVYRFPRTRLLITHDRRHGYKMETIFDAAYTVDDGEGPEDLG